MLLNILIIIILISSKNFQISMGFPTHNVKSTLPQTNVFIDQQVQTVKHTTTKVIKKAKSDTRAPRYAYAFVCTTSIGNHALTVFGRTVVSNRNQAYRYKSQTPNRTETNRMNAQQSQQNANLVMHARELPPGQTSELL